jgi:alpha-glucosidase (family GH31 glycosyl hydrolase)
MNLLFSIDLNLHSQKKSCNILKLIISVRHQNDNGVLHENREVHNMYGALMAQASYYGLLVRDDPEFN